MSVQKLKEVLCQIDYPVLVEVVDVVWCRVGDEIHWNAEDNKEDLEDGDGETYSVEVRQGDVEYDGYLVVNGDGGCGETCTYFFNLSKEVVF